MKNMDSVLPDGAKGIQSEGFAVAFGGDKIVFTLKPRPRDGSDWEATEKHYTVHAGQNSGVVDIHETYSFPDGHKEHRTLFALRVDDLPTVLQQLSSMLPRDDWLDTPVADRVDEAP